MNISSSFLLLVLWLPLCGLLEPLVRADVFDVAIDLGAKPFRSLHLMSLMNSTEPGLEVFRVGVCEEVEKACKRNQCDQHPCSYFRAFDLHLNQQGRVTLTRIVCESEAQRQQRVRGVGKEDVHVLQQLMGTPAKIDLSNVEVKSCGGGGPLETLFRSERVRFSYALGAFLAEELSSSLLDEHEFLELSAELKALKKPPKKLVDQDLEDALSAANFNYPDKTIYSKSIYPHYLLKADQGPKRFRTATLVSSVVREFQISNVVVPKKEVIYLPNLDVPALVVERLLIETDQAKVKQLYHSLSTEEATSIAFTLLKSRLKDIAVESGLQNLPFIRGTRKLAVIDTGAGTIDVDADLIEAYNEFTKIFSPEVQREFKKMTPELLSRVNLPQDLLKGTPK